MSAKHSLEIEEIMEATHCLPCISIILPFEPKMSAKQELKQMLRRALATVQDECEKSFSDEKTKYLVNKLEGLFATINFSTFKKSIAIYVSPAYEKTFYLNIPVEEKIIISDSFEIRDLIYNKKEIHEYLLVILNEKKCHIYLCNTTQFTKVICDKVLSAETFENDIPERVSNFSTPSERKEEVLEKFLHHADTALGQLIKAYELPIFILGADRILGHFRKITHHKNQISSYIKGNFSEASEADIRQAIQPFIQNWKNLKQQDLLRRIDASVDAGKLISGIKNVWQAVTHKKGRLLIVEKNYTYTATIEELNGIHNNTEVTEKIPLYIKDAVDDIIEKILSNGGDVEFVDEGKLCNYQQIVLICWQPE